MTPQERMALALAYQQRRPDLGDLSPEQLTAMQAPTQQPTMSFLDRLSETGAGIGKGLANQVEGVGQMVTHPIETGKEIYRNLSDIVSNPSLIVDALKQMGEKAASSPAGFGEVVGENINPRNLAKTLAKGMAKPVMQELIVAHGTPHRFPPTENNPLGEFDASKIGTGEGAQAYGHGIYLAESPDVAEGYKKTLAYKAFDLAPEAEKRGIKMSAGARGEFLRQVQNDAPPEVLARRLQNANISAREIPLDKLTDMFDAYKKQGGGSLYTVDLPDEKIAQMLDWDKPISKQTPEVANALRNMLKKAKKSFEGIDTESDPMAGQVHHLYSQHRGGNAAAVAAELQSLGIPGIKYLDAGSRDVGKGTRNFVVFPGEEKHLKILERK